MLLVRTYAGIEAVDSGDPGYADNRSNINNSRSHVHPGQRRLTCLGSNKNSRQPWSDPISLLLRPKSQSRTLQNVVSVEAAKCTIDIDVSVDDARETRLPRRAQHAPVDPPLGKSALPRDPAVAFKCLPSVTPGSMLHLKYIQVFELMEMIRFILYQSIQVFVMINLVVKHQSTAPASEDQPWLDMSCSNPGHIHTHLDKHTLLTYSIYDGYSDIYVQLVYSKVMYTGISMFCHAMSFQRSINSNAQKAPPPPFLYPTLSPNASPGCE